MKKAYSLTLSFVVMITLSLAFTRRDPGYKNLKVLPQDITEKQMDSVMHHYTSALGVKCGFCHVRNEDIREWDFASDDKKHKLAARAMMVMMDSINDQYFNLTGAQRDINTQLMVTCFTCHHGKTEPETKPTPPKPALAPWDSTKREQ